MVLQGSCFGVVPAGVGTLGEAYLQGNTGVVKAVLARQVEGFRTGSPKFLPARLKECNKNGAC